MQIKYCLASDIAVDTIFGVRKGATLLKVLGMLDRAVRIAPWLWRDCSRARVGQDRRHAATRRECRSCRVSYTTEDHLSISGTHVR